MAIALPLALSTLQAAHPHLLDRLCGLGTRGASQEVGGHAERLWLPGSTLGAGGYREPAGSHLAPALRKQPGGRKCPPRELTIQGRGS